MSNLRLWLGLTCGTSLPFHPSALDSFPVKPNNAVHAITHVIHEAEINGSHTLAYEHSQNPTLTPSRDNVFADRPTVLETGSHPLPFRPCAHDPRWKKKKEEEQILNPLTPAITLSNIPKPDQTPAPSTTTSRASRASVSSCRARASVLWERLSCKRVTVGPYSPRRIGNSRIVPTVLTRHLQSSSVFCSPRPSPAVLAPHLQSSPITCRAHQSPTGPVRHPELPGKSRHLRHLQSPQVRPRLSSGRTPRYPSVPGALSGTAVRPVRT